MPERIGLLWTWWRGDAPGTVSSRERLGISNTKDTYDLARVFGYETGELEQRFSSDHRAYVVSLNGAWVACGWSATGSTSFGVPEVRFTVPPENSYLLDFITLPAWRGKGIYPYLLQTIISKEAIKANRFWVIHEAGNHASSRGIDKAGFSLASEVYSTEKGLGLKAVNPVLTESGANVRGLPIIERL